MKDLIKNRRTLAKVCRFTSLTGLTVGVGWLVVFVATNQWSMALSLLLLGMSTIPCWMTARHHSLSRGLLGAQIACVVFIVLFALSFDIPTDTAPRTTHLYLLVIALIGYINVQIENSKTQFGVLAITLIAFIVFSSSSISIPLEPLPSEQFHLTRAWVNAVLATVVLCGGLCAMHIELSSSMRAAFELRTALENQQFELFYQPQLNARGQIIGAEALLRWRHPKRGYVPPAEFLPVAQKSGLMPSLGSWVLREACKTLALWQSQPNTQNLTLSINVTAEQFAVPGFVEALLKETNRVDVSPRHLKLELTENAVLSDIDSVVSRMLRLRAAGFEISLDDFGTGYSSLSYLRTLPLSQLKIDRSFVSGIDNNQRAAALTRNIVQIGHDLSLEVLAEGVETQAQLAVMQSFGCTLFQGYLFAKPMRIEDFEKFAANGTINMRAAITQPVAPVSRKMRTVSQRA